jgi:hypothetical protein
MTITDNCTLESCPQIGWGHSLIQIPFRLRHNRDFTDWWFESDCAPGQRQHASALSNSKNELLAHLRAWRVTYEVLKAEGAMQGGLL